MTPKGLRKGLAVCVEAGVDPSGMIRGRSRTGSTRIGDSGGPLLARANNEIAGVLSGGEETRCDGGCTNLCAPLALNLDFIDEALRRTRER